MKRTLVMLAFVLALPSLAAAQAPALPGDWSGVLKTPAADLHLELHIVARDDGGFTATMDSVDQHAIGIEVTTITVRGSRLTFAVARVGGSYEGTINAGASEIAGEWTQGLRTTLNFTREPAKPDVKPSDIDGAWAGTLAIGATPLRVVVHFRNTADGLAATLDSPDQGAKNIPVASVTRVGPALKLDVRAVGGTFEGTIDQPRTQIEGTWTQVGRTTALVLSVVRDPATLVARRPQTPSRPYPYRDEEVAYVNSAAPNVTLAATLTLPPGPGPFPAVVLITGSGPQDRDEMLFEHRPFLVIADYLTRRGIAVLRADDRGFAKSTGTFSTATTADFATDVEAGVAFLRTRKEIDPAKIGLIGHSEGAAIAPMVAARDPRIAFIVLMAGPGVRGDDVLVEQNRLVAEAVGATAEQADARAAVIRQLTTIDVEETDAEVRGQKMRDALAGKGTPEEIKTQIAALNTPWMRYFLAYDPGPALRAVKCPVLAINGEKDVQVPPRQNLPAIRAAFQASGNTRVEVDELPGLNHLFQTAKTGSPAEYAQIEETIAPIALDTMGRWIAAIQ